MFKERIVYSHTTKRKCWNLREGHYTATIATYIVEKTKWLWKKYEIRQIVPYIAKPFYDGEYATNNNLQSAADYERKVAELAITMIKDGQDINNIWSDDNP